MKADFVVTPFILNLAILMSLRFTLATDKDLPVLQQLFKETIQSICSTDYNEQQIIAWSAGAENTDRWLKRMKEQYFLLAWKANEIVGFCSLTNNGYLDLLFVHAQHQRQGIAHQLYQQIEIVAKMRGLDIISTDASITAKPFFVAAGFKTIAEQVVHINHIALSNFRMQKQLTGE